MRTWREVRNEICPVSAFCYEQGSCFVNPPLCMFDRFTLFPGSQLTAARENSWYVLGRHEWHKHAFSRGMLIGWIGVIKTVCFRSVNFSVVPFCLQFTSSMRVTLHEESNSLSSFSVLLDDDSRYVPWPNKKTHGFHCSRPFGTTTVAPFHLCLFHFSLQHTLFARRHRKVDAEHRGHGGERPDALYSWKPEPCTYIAKEGMRVVRRPWANEECLALGCIYSSSTVVDRMPF